jgi:hypothetical protein
MSWLEGGRAMKDFPQLEFESRWARAQQLMEE